jgi:hypothetical protein
MTYGSHVRAWAACSVALGTLACSAEDSPTGRRDRGNSDPFHNASGSGPGTGTAGAGGPDPIGGGCASISVAANRRTPEVMIVVDGSGSMEDDFGNGTRWTELDAALNDATTGIVPQLAGSVEFGLTIYQRADINTCPTLTEVPVALDNAAAIGSTYDGVMPQGGTPTGEGLQAVVDKMESVAAMVDEEIQPRIIILATDGMPNGCGEPPDMTICPNVPPLIPGFPEGPDLFCVLNYFANLPPDYQGTVDAAHAAKLKGIDVYVISLAPGMQQQSELQRVANVGVGLDEAASPGAPIYDAADPQSLRDALARIVGGAVGCKLQLEGELDVARACSGTVKLNGAPLGCDDANGWRAIDTTQIELMGAACDQFESDPSVVLDASWPCGVVTVI